MRCTLSTSLLLVTLLCGVSRADIGFFESDRFDLYRQGTNDVPITMEIFQPNSTPIFLQCLGPASYLEIFDIGSNQWYFSGSVTWTATDSYAANPAANAVVSRYSGMSIMRAPAHFTMDGPGGSDIFQIDWIEPSLDWCFTHFYYGFGLAIPLDMLGVGLSAIFGAFANLRRL